KPQCSTTPIHAIGAYCSRDNRPSTASASSSHWVAKHPRRFSTVRTSARVPTLKSQGFDAWTEACTRHLPTREWRQVRRSLGRKQADEKQGFLARRNRLRLRAVL